MLTESVIPALEKPLDIKQAAQFLGYSVQTLYNLKNNAKIPFHKKQGKLYFYRSELNKWIKK